MNTPEQDWQDRAMSYSLDEDELGPCPICNAPGRCDCLNDVLEHQIQADRDRRFEAMLEAEEKRQREAVKKACIAGLLALGIMPRSLVRERR